MGLADEVNSYIPAVIGLGMTKVLLDKTKGLNRRPTIHRIKRVKRRKENKVRRNKNVR